MDKKNICVVTGTRAEYGLLKIVIQKIEESEVLKLSLIVTGMHLLKKFGGTINVIKKDGFPISKIVPMYEEKEKNLGKALGNGVINLTHALKEIKPDILLILGDRYEPLAAALAASTLNIPIAHIHGGDNVHKGQVDEQIRHAITKFANLHFPVSPKSYERIKLLGEEEWRIHLVGSPGLDMIFNETLLNKEEICNEFNLEINQKIVLCVYHPYIIEKEKAGEQMGLILKILKDMNLQTIIIYPNNDPGCDLIIKEIESMKNTQKFLIFKNLERKLYLSLLKHSDLLIGNSSSGIIESPVFNLPVINLGNRNRGRETGENVINVFFDHTKITEAVNKALSNDFKNFCKTVKNPYGKGKASEKIVKILEEIEINKKLLIKKLNYKV